MFHLCNVLHWKYFRNCVLQSIFLPCGHRCLQNYCCIFPALFPVWEALKMRATTRSVRVNFFGIKNLSAVLIFLNKTYFVWYCGPGNKDNAKISNGIASESQGEVEASLRNPDSTTVMVQNHLFAEKLVPVLVDLFLQAPPAQKYKIFPEIIQSLGRWELIMYGR